MDHGLHVLARVIDGQMHAHLSGGRFLARNPAAVHVADDQFGWVQHALSDTGRRSEDMMRPKTDGNIAVIGGNPAIFIHQAADVDNVLAMLLLGFVGLSFVGYRKATARTIN